MDAETRAVRLARLGRAAEEAKRAWDTLRVQRDREVDQADQDGMPLREIARNVGLAPVTVTVILGRLESERQRA